MMFRFSKPVRYEGIEIPTLCHDERIKACGACRLCVVEANGKTVASCQNKLADGMEVETHSPKIETSRRTDLKMLALNYPFEDFLLYPEKKFHRLAKQYNLKDADFAQPEKRIDDSHIFIQVDMTRCIDCYACVRICEELQGQFVWQIVGARAKTRKSFPIISANSVKVRVFPVVRVQTFARPVHWKINQF